MTCAAVCAVPDTEREQRPAETAPSFPATLSTQKVTSTSPRERLPPVSHSLPQQFHPTQYTRDSGEVSERSAEVEESHDGSYLWLQRQVQWRAGSLSMPDSAAVRETRRVGFGETSPSRLGREGRKAEISGSNHEAREGGMGVGMSMSGSAEASGSVASPGVIPNFRTLQDQQVSLTFP